MRGGPRGGGAGMGGEPNQNPHAGTGERFAPRGGMGGPGATGEFSISTGRGRGAATPRRGGAISARGGRGGRGGGAFGRGGGQPPPHPGLSREQKRQLVAELKGDFRDMCTTIAQHFADEGTKRLDKKLEG